MSKIFIEDRPFKKGLIIVFKEVQPYFLSPAQTKIVGGCRRNIGNLLVDLSGFIDCYQFNNVVSAEEICMGTPDCE